MIGQQWKVKDKDTEWALEKVSYVPSPSVLNRGQTERSKFQTERMKAGKVPPEFGGKME